MLLISRILTILLLVLEKVEYFLEEIIFVLIFKFLFSLSYWGNLTAELTEVLG